MINIDKYPRAAELIKDCVMDDMVGQIRWLHINREDTAISLAKLYLISTMSTSNSITAREKSKNLTIQSYFSIGGHAFNNLRALKLIGYIKAEDAV